MDWTVIMIFVLNLFGERGETASSQHILAGKCQEPGPLSGAYRTGWNTSSAQYVCLDSHVPTDEFQVICEHAKWSRINRCILDCGPPAEIAGTTVSYNKTIEDAVAIYTCIENFTDTGLAPKTRTCSGVTGLWDNTGPVCIGAEDLAFRKASNDSHLNDGDPTTCYEINTSALITLSSDVYYNVHTVLLMLYHDSAGDVRITLRKEHPDEDPYDCITLIKPSAGVHNITCSWRFESNYLEITSLETSVDVCDVQVYGRTYIGDCMGPPIVTGAKATYNTTVFKSKAEYSCLPPYVYIGGKNTSVCRLSGWSKPSIACAEKDNFAVSSGLVDDPALVDSDGSTCGDASHFIVIRLTRLVEVEVVVLEVKRRQKWTDLTVVVLNDDTKRKPCQADTNSVELDEYKMKAFFCHGSPFANVIRIYSDTLEVCEVKIYGRDASDGALECRQTTVGWDYKGSVNFTVSGKTCMTWREEDLNLLPDYSLDMVTNKCRSRISEDNAPVCYVAPGVTEYCPIPICDEVCRQGDGRTYNGHIAKSVEGISCVSWDSNPDQFALSELISNREEATCRNPIGSMSQPWCYTGSTLGYSLCDVPFCPTNIMHTDTVSSDEQTECFCRLGSDLMLHFSRTIMTDVVEKCLQNGIAILLCYRKETDEHQWTYYRLEEFNPTTESESSSAVTSTSTETIKTKSRENETTSTTTTSTATFTSTPTLTVPSTTTATRTATTTTIPTLTIPPTTKVTRTATTTIPTLTVQPTTTATSTATATATTTTTTTTTAIPTPLIPPTTLAATISTTAEINRTTTTTITFTTTTMTTPVPPFHLNCRCRCKMDLSEGGISEVIAERKVNLTVNPRETSAFIRKKTSATDKRQAATVSGTSCVAIVSVMFSFLFIPDLISAFNFFIKVKP